MFPGDMSSRHFKPEIRVTSLRFSPTGEPGTSARGGGGGPGGFQACPPVALLPGQGRHGASGRLWALPSPGKTWSPVLSEEGWDLPRAGLEQ